MFTLSLPIVNLYFLSSLSSRNSFNRNLTPLKDSEIIWNKRIANAHSIAYACRLSINTMYFAQNLYGLSKSLLLYAYEPLSCHFHLTPLHYSSFAGAAVVVFVAKAFAFASSNLQIPPVLSASGRTPICGPSFSKTGSVSSFLK